MDVKAEINLQKDDKMNKKCSFVGRLFSYKLFNPHILKSIIQNHWGSEGGVKVTFPISRFGKNLHVLQFENEKGVLMIKSHKLYNVNGNVTEKSTTKQTA